MVDTQPEDDRYRLYSVMEWCHKHRTQILHHIAWRDSCCITNVFKTITVNGSYPDYSEEYGEEFFNEEEKKMAQRAQKQQHKQKRRAVLTMWIL